MPRDASGNYSLPSGNPVVGGTVISSTWANPTMADIAQELTNSLDRNGRGGMLAPFKFADGSVTEPAISFTTQPATGFYLAALNDMRVAVGGDDVMKFVDASGDPAGQQKPLLIYNGVTFAPPLAADADGILRVNTGPIQIADDDGTGGRLLLRQDNAVLDAKTWDMRVANGNLAFRAVNDADDTTTSWLTVNRTAMTIDSITAVATAIELTGAVTVNGGSVNDASLITSGTFSDAVIPNLDAAKIASGTLSVDRIPDMDAAKIATGTFSAARIPSLDAGKITTGEFSAALIPNLNASKINAGVLSSDRIPDLAAGKITSGTLSVDRIPDLDAGKVTTGQFSAGRIPGLDASKINSGVLSGDRLPDATVTTKGAQLLNSTKKARGSGYDWDRNTNIIHAWGTIAVGAQQWVTITKPTLLGASYTAIYTGGAVQLGNGINPTPGSSVNDIGLNISGTTVKFYNPGLANTLYWQFTGIAS